MKYYATSLSTKMHRVYEAEVMDENVLWCTSSDVDALLGLTVRLANATVRRALKFDSDSAMCTYCKVRIRRYDNQRRTATRMELLKAMAHSFNCPVPHALEFLDEADS